MRIVAFVPSLVIGGAERSLGKLLKVIAPNVERVDLICMSGADKEALSELPDSINIHIFNAISSASPFLWVRAIKLCREINPDLILGWSTYANFVSILVAPFCSGVRLIVSERNYFPLMYGRDKNKKLRSNLVLFLIKKLYRRADIITANSFSTVKALKRFVGADINYKLLPNTVDVDFLDHLAKAELEDLPVDVAPNFLAVGRLVPQKGFDVLLRAFAIVHSLRPNWILTIVGHGPERGSLEALAISLGLSKSIRWIGAQPNPFPFYRWSNVVIVPSRFEGFPNVPLEAMALGRAVICSDCRSGPSELTLRGRYGKLVPVENVCLLARAIVELGDSPESARLIGEAARAHVMNRYDVSVVGAHYSEIFSKT